MNILQEADIGFGSISITSLRETAIDFTNYYHKEYSGLIGSKPLPFPKWMSLFEPFDILVWIILISSLFVVSLFSWLIGRSSLKILKPHSIGDTFFCIITLFFGEGFGRNEIRKSMSSIVYITWALCSLIICVAYSGCLMSSITVPSRPKPLQTLEEIYNSNDAKFFLQFGNVYYSLFAGKQLPIYEKMWNKILKTCPEECIINGSVDEEKYLMDDPSRFTISDYTYIYNIALSTIKQIFVLITIKIKMFYFQAIQNCTFFRKNPILLDLDLHYSRDPDS